MNSQDKSPELLKKQDNILPLILTGLFSSYICICICMCVSILFIGRYSSNEVPPMGGLREPMPTATMPPAPCPALPTDWEEVMDDKFGPNVHMWPLGNETDSYGNRKIEIKNGALRFSLKVDRGFYISYNPKYIGVQHDFYLLSKMRHTNGPVRSNYGVTFHSYGEDYYYFSINNAREIQIFKHNDNEKNPWEFLYSAVSLSVQPSEYNELVVLAQDSHFTFCVNQQVVAEIDDDSYPSGDTGIGMSLEQSDNEELIELDNFTIYAPK